MSAVLRRLAVLLWALACGALQAAPAAADPLSLEAAQNYAGPAAASAPPVARPAVAPASPTAQDAQLEAYVRLRSRLDDAYLTLMLTVSGVAVLFLGFTMWLSTRESNQLSGRDLMRAAVVVFIAYGAVVLGLAMPQTEVMTGVIGILSAIVGYVFGRSGGDDRAARPSGDRATPKP